jgi:hypothetical protein
MYADNSLQQEIKELRLLITGLSKVPGFPAELLELMNLHTENITRLISAEPESDEKTRSTGSVKSLNDILAQPTCVNDRKESKRLVDISKLLTLNDRFRFQREFFGNDAQKMATNLATMNQLGSLEDALAFFKEICPLGEDSDCFPDFYMMLEQWFPQKPADAV